ncbi:MAG: ribosomal L7Ae/L30e/S12e/Gadd45 family protein [Gudongella sp.]|nr:ribosomal L7Ae/L30e/S12e/Gadd45 family protein [Gudongella sp.]
MSQNEKVVGAKQVKRALSNSEVEVVFIALDADRNVTDEIVELSKEKEVHIQYVEKMQDLGEACGIDINAAVAALLNKN